MAYLFIDTGEEDAIRDPGPASMFIQPGPHPTVPDQPTTGPTVPDHGQHAEPNRDLTLANRNEQELFHPASRHLRGVLNTVHSHPSPASSVDRR